MIRIRWTVVGMILTALLSQPFTLFAKQSGDWAAVKGLSKGQEVRVENKAGKKFDGTLDTVSDTKIVISNSAGSEEISYTDVKKVHRVESGSRAPGVAIGAAIGAGIGLGIGGVLLAATGGSDSGGKVIAPFIAAGAGLGALAGAFVKKKKRTLIYEAK